MSPPLRDPKRIAEREAEIQRLQQETRAQTPKQNIATIREARLAVMRSEFYYDLLLATDGINDSKQLEKATTLFLRDFCEQNVERANAMFGRRPDFIDITTQIQEEFLNMQIIRVGEALASVGSSKFKEHKKIKPLINQRNQLTHLTDKVALRLRHRPTSIAQLKRETESAMAVLRSYQGNAEVDCPYTSEVLSAISSQLSSPPFRSTLAGAAHFNEVHAHELSSKFGQNLQQDGTHEIPNQIFHHEARFPTIGSDAQTLHAWRNAIVHQINFDEASNVVERLWMQSTPQPDVLKDSTLEMGKQPVSRQLASLEKQYVLQCKKQGIKVEYEPMPDNVRSVIGTLRREIVNAMALGAKRESDEGLKKSLESTMLADDTFGQLPPQDSVLVRDTLRGINRHLKGDIASPLNASTVSANISLWKELLTLGNMMKENGSEQLNDFLAQSKDQAPITLQESLPRSRKAPDNQPNTSGSEVKPLLEAPFDHRRIA